MWDFHSVKTYVHSTSLVLTSTRSALPIGALAHGGVWDAVKGPTFVRPPMGPDCVSMKANNTHQEPGKGEQYSLPDALPKSYCTQRQSFQLISWCHQLQLPPRWHLAHGALKYWLEDLASIYVPYSCHGWSLWGSMTSVVGQTQEGVELGPRPWKTLDLCNQLCHVCLVAQSAPLPTLEHPVSYGSYAHWHVLSYHFHFPPTIVYCSIVQPANL